MVLSPSKATVQNDNPKSPREAYLCSKCFVRQEMRPHDRPHAERGVPQMRETDKL